MIHQLVQADTFKNYYKVGDTKSVTLSTGEVVYMQVASINNGEGDAGAWYPRGTVDFISADCLQTTYQMNTTQTNEGGWSSSGLRKTLNNTIVNTLPTELQNIITEKTHKTSAGSGGAELVEHSDKLWIPTECEVFGTSTNYSATTENANYNNQYGIFTDAGSRTKYLGTGGSPTRWWLCSPVGRGNNSENHGSFCWVTRNGKTDNFVAEGGGGAHRTDTGVTICFRVG